VLRERLVAIAALCFQLGMPFNEWPGHDEPLEQRLGSGAHVKRQPTKGRDRHNCRAPASQRATPSIEVNSPDVDDPGKQHQKEQRQMQNVPQRKQALIERKLGGLEHGRRVKPHDSKELPLPPPSFKPRPSRGSSFDANQPSGLREEVGSHEPCPHRQHGTCPEVLHRPHAGTLLDALAERIQLLMNKDRRLHLITKRVLERFSFGKDLLGLGLTAVQPDMDLAVDLLSDDAAKGHDQHRKQCNVAVDRSQLEVRVEQDQHGSDYAENHVGPKPKRYRTDHAPSFVPLAK